jgi:hypothetical protein
MATLSNFTSMNGSATANMNPEPMLEQKAAAAPAQHESASLPADGLLLADTTAYRTVDRKFLSHNAGLVSGFMDYSLQQTMLVAGTQQCFLHKAWRGRIYMAPAAHGATPQLYSVTLW